MMRRKSLFVVLVLALAVALALASGALAQLVPNGRLGPINTYVPSPDGGVTPATGNGFPLWVEDVNGVKLDLPVKPIGNGVDPPTMIFDPPIVGNQFSEDIGFGAEAFYFLATSRIDLGGGDRAELTLGVEAAFGAEDPVDGDQFLFNRVRIRIDTPVAGTYTVTHPWGSKTFEVADAAEGINFTFDYGGFAPLCPNQPPCLTDAAGQPLAPAGFERFLVSPTPWVFLKATTMAEGVDQNSWMGDGVTETAVTGGLNNNTFRVVGPTLDVSTDQFTVTGHIYGGTTPPPPPPVQTDSVTITRTRLRGNAVEVRATSSNGFAMSGEILDGSGAVIGATNLGTSGRGNISFTGTPVTARVHSISPNPASITPGVATAPIPFP